MQFSLFKETANLLPHPGECYYYPGFLSSAEGDQYFTQLAEEINWRQEPITIAGKKVMQPRLTAWYGDLSRNYRYSGITMKAIPWSKNLLEIKKRTEDFSGHFFNGALLNLYRTGMDSMGWHRDNEKELGSRPVIASVSLGAARIFELRRWHDKDLKISLELAHGSLLLMLGETNHYWEHRIPKTKLTTGIRINITFRIIL
jgi:alkylated DNA repair dioxygenase AlkB